MGMPYGAWALMPRKEVCMAKTYRDKKIVHVKPYVRKTDKGKVKVPEHYRSTPN